MKKITFLAAFALLALAIPASAQIQKGNVMVGGNILTSGFQFDANNAFDITLNPKAAWFISDGVALGADVNLGYSTADFTGNTLSYGVGALGRYYGAKGANEVINHSRFFGEATVGINGRNINPYGDVASSNTTGLGFSFGPGFTYFITQSVGLEALVKYNGIVGFGNQTYTHGLGLGFGFQIYLPGKSTANKVQRDMK